MVEEDYKFNSINELYERLMPALKSKKRELSREGMFYIQEKDIWSYLVSKKWRNKNDLRLYELVNDIFDMDGIILTNYVKEQSDNYQKYNDRNEKNA